MSCSGNGYLSGNTLVAFPFEDAQPFGSGSEHDELVLRAVYACFADASVSVFGDVSEGWPSIGRISSDGSSLSFSIFACGHEVGISVSCSTNCKFPIVRGSEAWGSYVIVLSSDGISDFCSLPPPARSLSRSSLAGGEGVIFRLCAKCVTVVPDGLSSIIVYDGSGYKSDVPSFVIGGDVSIRSGNNMRLAPVDDDDSSVEINAEPGAGLGVVECECDDVKSSDGILIAGKDGHARIFNDTCYDLEPNTSTGEIVIHAKCTACCTCQMYESIVNERLAAIADVIRNARRDISEIHQSYESAVSEFNRRISSPSISDIGMTLSGMPVGRNVSPKISNKKVNGKMGRCVFTATIVNSSFFDVTASVTSVASSGNVVEASAAWSAADGSPLSMTGDSALSVYGSYLIYPGRSLVITFIAVDPRMVSDVVTGGYSGSVSASIAWSGGALGVLSKSVRA